MYTKNLFRLVLLLAIIIMVGSTTGCKNKTNSDLATPQSSCEGCHTDYEHLKLVFTPDTAAPVGGCGGEAPHYEPYDRVYMGGSGYDSYKGSSHDLACTECHNGVDETDDKTVAHSGDFMKHPSDNYVEKCGICHADITSDFATSLHKGTGQKRKVTMRSGLTGHEQFDQLPQHQIEGYNANCATCHGTCGNCHVVRPPIAGGGLEKGHGFTKTPDMLNTCISCHTSRGGHAYLGRGVDMDPTIVPDVHLTSPNAGFSCTDCHTGNELHGNGQPIDHRYEYTELPSCTSSLCHDNIATANNYHSNHIETFNCQVCHSQDYNSCGSCHVHGDGARLPSHLDFKIAINPLIEPDENHDFKYALVRRTLAAPDNWDLYTDQDYSNFDEFPMFNYTTPHNIQKWTTRTETSGACYLSCHIYDDGGTLVNKELYLFMDDLVEPWQVSSTAHITVDQILPIDWFTK